VAYEPPITKYDPTLSPAFHFTLIVPLVLRGLYYPTLDSDLLFPCSLLANSRLGSTLIRKGLGAAQGKPPGSALGEALGVPLGDAVPVGTTLAGRPNRSCNGQNTRSSTRKSTRRCTWATAGAGDDGKFTTMEITANSLRWG
jgi:hypothetical protein